MVARTAGAWDVGRTLVEFLIVALAAHRITRMLTEDEWPPILWAREKIIDWSQGKRKGKWTEKKHPAIETLATCPWCVGMYVSGAAVLLWQFTVIPIWVYMIPAVSSLVGGYSRWVQDKED